MKLQGLDIDVVRKGSGQPLLLLHGGGGPIAQMPSPTGCGKVRDHRADPSGVQRQQNPQSFTRVDDLVFLYLDLLDELDLSDVVLMGFSMGGWTAAELAVANSTRLSRLILVDSVGVKVGGREDRDIADVFALPGEKLAEIMFHDPSLAPNPAEIPDEQLQIVAGNRTALGVYTWDPYMHNPKLPHRLHRIKIPTHSSGAPATAW